MNSVSISGEWKYANCTEHVPQRTKTEKFHRLGLPWSGVELSLIVGNTNARSKVCGRFYFKHHKFSALLENFQRDARTEKQKNWMVCDVCGCSILGALQSGKKIIIDFLIRSQFDYIAGANEIYVRLGMVCALHIDSWSTEYIVRSSERMAN